MQVMTNSRIHLKVNMRTIKIFMIQMDEIKTISLINIRWKNLKTFKKFKIRMKIIQCKQISLVN